MQVDLSWLLATDYTQPMAFATITAILSVAIFGRYLLLAWIYHQIFYRKLGKTQPFYRLHQQIKVPQTRK